MQPKNIPIGFIGHDMDVSDMDNGAWESVSGTAVSTYWCGMEAPTGRHFSFRMLWSAENLYVRFAANTDEPLVISEMPGLSKKTVGLWDRDVCEIFIAPDPGEPRKYFEFEAAPTGEWLDVAIDLTGGERISDWEYASGMQTAARIENDRVTMAMKIPFTAFGKAPTHGDVWLGNVFRCVGKDPDRGYLAWSPTLTDVPAYHMPERFGEFYFV